MTTVDYNSWKNYMIKESKYAEILATISHIEIKSLLNIGIKIESESIFKLSKSRL